MAPDLRTVVDSQALDKRRAKELARESSEAGVLALVAEGPFFRSGDWLLQIPQVHEFLADDADWDAVTWSMEESGRDELARTLEWLYERLPGEFTFEALWGEEPIEVYVNRDELLRIVRAGRIGTKTRYRVRAG